MAAMQAMSMSMPGMDMGAMDMTKPAPKAAGSAPAMPGMDMNQPGSMDRTHQTHTGSASSADGGSAAPMPSMPGM